MRMRGDWQERAPRLACRIKLLRLVLTPEDAGETGDREGSEDQSHQHLGHIEQIENSSDCDGQLLLAVQLGCGKRYGGERPIARARTPMLLVAKVDEREEDVQRIGERREAGIFLFGALVILAIVALQRHGIDGLVLAGIALAALRCPPPYACEQDNERRHPNHGPPGVESIECEDVEQPALQARAAGDGSAAALAAATLDGDLARIVMITLGGKAAGQVHPGLRFEVLNEVVARLPFEPADAHVGCARAPRAVTLLRRQSGWRLEVLIDEAVQHQMVEVVLPATLGSRPRRRRILVAADMRAGQIDDPL